MNDNQVSLVELLLAAKRYRWLVVAFVVAGLVLGWARSAERLYRYDSSLQLGWVVDEERVEPLETVAEISRRVEQAIQSAVAGEYRSEVEGRERYLEVALAKDPGNQFLEFSTRAPLEYAEFQRRYHQAILDNVLDRQTRRYASARKRFDDERAYRAGHLKIASDPALRERESAAARKGAAEAESRWHAFVEAQQAYEKSQRAIEELLRSTGITGLSEQNLRRAPRVVNARLYRRFLALVAERDQMLERLSTDGEGAPDEVRRALYDAWESAEAAVHRADARYEQELLERQRQLDELEGNAERFVEPRITLVANPTKVVGNKPAALVIALGAILGLVLGVLSVFALVLYDAMKRVLEAADKPGTTAG